MRILFKVKNGTFISKTQTWEVTDLYFPINYEITIEDFEEFVKFMDFSSISHYFHYWKDGVLETEEIQNLINTPGDWEFYIEERPTFERFITEKYQTQVELYVNKNLVFNPELMWYNEKECQEECFKDLNEILKEEK